MVVGGADCDELYQICFERFKAHTDYSVLVQKY